MLGLSSGIYGRAVLARRRLIEARPASRLRLNAPVISIGNLNVGGSGKTPFTAWLAARLANSGYRPSILSRGYRRTAPTNAVVIVSDGSRVRADLPAAGDEPLMLARAVPAAAVLVCPERYRAGRVAEGELGSNVHLLDDGFQHLRLDRDVDLVMLDERDLRDRPLPAGRLREPLEALRSADAIMWTGDPAHAADVGALTGVKDVFPVRRVAGPVRTWMAGAQGTARAQAGMEGQVAGAQGSGPTTGEPVLALAAIAHPERFFEELEDIGVDVRARMAFPDHHPYTAGDVERIRKAAAGCGAAWVITTEKDLVRLMPFGGLPFRLAWRSLEVSPREPELFWDWLVARLRAAGGPSTARGATIA
ncbi:MAG TPA: tetraacyldisaccharide 4'-kinase [Vicinamibacterales bacterium]|nr:tetraacyldisaccharide 4'-kinase [Vicinamibacterales bacterium]